MTKKNNKNLNIYDIIFCNPYFLYFSNYDTVNNQLNWGELWSRKIDNIEYQLHHIEIKYPIIKKSIDYYIGMTESAISYINGMDLSNSSLEVKVITHSRIYEDNINDPQNIVIDYRSRDIAEYLKYIFINDTYDYSKIRNSLNSLDFSKFLWQLVYARMFFPNFYFDKYDSIIINEMKEDSLITIINKIEEYEVYLDNIYDIICEQKKIPKIIWN